jgi:hypothetical protein
VAYLISSLIDSCLCVCVAADVKVVAALGWGLAGGSVSELQSGFHQEPAQVVQDKLRQHRKLVTVRRAFGLNDSSSYGANMMDMGSGAWA